MKRVIFNPSFWIKAGFGCLGEGWGLPANDSFPALKEKRSSGDCTCQAGIGDVVYMIGRKEAALMLDLKDPPPSDLTIAGIIDPETL